MSSGFTVLFVIVVFGAYVCSGAQVCKPHSSAILCGSVCEPTCEHPIEIACRVDPRTCTTDCRCLGGFVRNKDDDCVEVKDCPPSSTTTENTVRST